MTKHSGQRAAAVALGTLALAAGLAFLATAGPLSGQQGPVVSMEDGQVPEGGSAVTRLWALDVTDPHVCEFTVDVTYDRLVNVATACQADPEGRFELAICNVDYALQTVRVAGVMGYDPEGVTGDIPLVDISWCALGGAGETSGLDVGVVSFVDCSLLPAEIATVADDGVNVITTGSPPVDTDGDGFHDCVESYMRTDPLDECPDDSSDDAWPPDNDNSGQVDLADVLRFKPYMNCSLGQGCYNNRFDLNVDGIVNLADVLGLKPYLGLQCA